MKQTKKEIEVELEHKRIIINVLRARLRSLEVQAATKGNNTPPEIITEMGALTEQIRIQKDEIADLETIAAEGQLSLAEAEYKLLLAEVWDTPVGRPTIGGSTRLELTRLRMGLSPERAKELEQLVRTALVEEIFQTLDLSPFLGGTKEGDLAYGTSSIAIHAGDGGQIGFGDIIVNQQITIGSVESVARIIGKSIRLNSQIALGFFLRCLPSDFDFDLSFFEKQLLNKNRTWINQEEIDPFDYFLKTLADHLSAR